MAKMNLFYIPLKRNEIRLLKNIPWEGNEQVAVTLKHASLDDPKL